MIDQRKAITRLCELQSKVSRNVHRSNYSADCFCGEMNGRRSARGLELIEFRNSGAAIDVIEKIVLEELRRHWLKRLLVDGLRSLSDRLIRRLQRKLGVDEYFE